MWGFQAIKAVFFYQRSKDVTVLPKRALSFDLQCSFRSNYWTGSDILPHYLLFPVQWVDRKEHFRSRHSLFRHRFLIEKDVAVSARKGSILLPEVEGRDGSALKSVILRPPVFLPVQLLDRK